MIAGDGVIYEGGGWDRVGAHTLGYNNDSIGISFIGDFTDRIPSHAARVAADHLISCGVSTVSMHLSLCGPPTDRLR